MTIVKYDNQGTPEQVKGFEKDKMLIPDVKGSEGILEAFEGVVKALKSWDGKALRDFIQAHDWTKEDWCMLADASALAYAYRAAHLVIKVLRREFPERVLNANSDNIVDWHTRRQFLQDNGYKGESFNDLGRLGTLIADPNYLFFLLGKGFAEMRGDFSASNLADITEYLYMQQAGIGMWQMEKVLAGKDPLLVIVVRKFGKGQKWLDDEAPFFATYRYTTKEFQKHYFPPEFCFNGATTRELVKQAETCLEATTEITIISEGATPDICRGIYTCAN